MRLLGAHGRLRVRKPAVFAGAMLLFGLLALAPIDSGTASGQTTLISDSFANSTTSSNVTHQGNGAFIGESILPCLTAGTPSSGASTIPACDLDTPAADGSGALRLTDANPLDEASDVIYNDTFPTFDGLDITFDVHMYGGTADPFYADGISFDLAAAPPPPGSVGQSGGALGYSTDGSGNPGMPGGYLGIGLDEYGNYSNPQYEGQDCHSGSGDPSWAGAAFDDNEVTVHGPGNGIVGYCLLNSTLAAGAGDPMVTTPISLHGNDFASSDIKVEIKIDTVTDPSNPTYSVTLTPASTGVTTPVVSGPLPTFYYDPATGHQVSAIPNQLSFAIAGSDGAASDVHEIDNVVANTISDNPLTTLDLSMTDNGTGSSPDSVSLGEPYEYTITPSVDSTSVPETEPVTVIDHLPAGQSLLAGFTAPITPGPAPSGTHWDCSATNFTTNTVECTYTGSAVDAGDPYPDITVPFAVSSLTSPNDQLGDTPVNTATASSSDSLGFASGNDTVTLTSTNPLLDASISDTDGTTVPIASPAFTLTLGGSLDANGQGETQSPVLSSTLPTDLEMTALPSGTNWDCTASSLPSIISCTWIGDPVSPGDPYSGPVTVPVQLSPSDDVGDIFTVTDLLASPDAGPYWAASAAADTITVTDTIIQVDPFSDSTTAANSFPHFDQLNTTGGNGAVTFLTTVDSEALLVDESTGDISTTGVLPAGTYTVSGTDSDTNNDTGTWTFTLYVTEPITQIDPFSDTVATGASAAYTSQIMTTGQIGPVTFDTTSSTPPGVNVDKATGDITTAGTLDPGMYTVSGTDSDPNTDMGTWTFTLTVTGPITQTAPFSDTVSTDSSATYTNQINTTGAIGTITFDTTSEADGLIVDPHTGVVTTTGTLAPDTYTVSGTDSDTNTDSGTWKFILTVIKNPDVGPTWVDDTPPLAASVGLAYVYDFVATGVPTPTYSLNAGAPGWLNIDSATGIVTGIPPADIAQFSYSVTATNSVSSITAGPFVVKVIAPTPVPTPPTPTPPKPTPPTPTPPTPTPPTPTPPTPTPPTPTPPFPLTPTPLPPTFTGTTGTGRVVLIPPATPTPVLITPIPSPGHPGTLSLSRSTVIPGESTIASGEGCTAGSPVTLSIDGTTVGATTANDQGAFSASIEPPVAHEGQLTVTATCGSTQLATLLALVTSSTVSTPEGGAAVFGVFLLVGFVLLRGQFTGNGKRRRRRRRTGADILAGRD